MRSRQHPTRFPPKKPRAEVLVSRGCSGPSPYGAQTTPHDKCYYVTQSATGNDDVDDDGDEAVRLEDGDWNGAAAAKCLAGLVGWKVN